MSDLNARQLGRKLRSFIDGFLDDLPASEPALAGDPEAAGHLPPAGIDGFLSHFVFTIKINKGPQKGELLSYTWPVAIQTVARSAPFTYKSGSAENSAKFPLPKESDLPRSLTEKSFLATPPSFFQDGRETIFLQILNLDARGETPYGKMRCILGETFKREYPDIFQPSFGAAQSLGRSGLPAKIFFVPNGIFETPFGALHTRPKALLGSRISRIPPVGSSPELLEPIPLDSVDELRANKNVLPSEPAATLVALAHPIDAVVFGDSLFERVEAAIARK
jgi:hypothetical protein